MITNPPNVLGSIATHVSRDPDATAVVDQDDRCSYAQLWRAAGRTAAAIHATGWAVQQPILLGLPPSSRWVAALLGVWWAGGIAVPLDLDQPPARLASLATACRASLVMTEDGHPAPWAPTLPVIPAGAGTLAHGDPPERDAGRAACVFFTSGSTGSPKPVLLGHLGLAHRAHDMADRYAINSADRVAQLTAPAFDPILWELLPALLRGGEIHIPDPRARIPGPDLAGWLAEHQITAFTCTPTVLAAVPFTDLPALRLIVLGGEALHPGPLDPWLARYPVANAYGPTELTTEALVALPVHHGQHPVPIGHPYPGVGVQILDDRHRPVPDGQVGELYLSGLGLALEYLGLPEQTTAAFPELDLGNGPVRSFRTGDLVRRLPDGQLTFMGRRDRQLNLGGVRLEPGEVEACARQVAGVRAAAATALAGERPILALFVVADPTVTVARVRRHLSAHLPAAAVPTHIQVVDQFPRTPSGKIDYTILSRNAHPAIGKSGAVDALAPLPERVLGWWQELTGQPAMPGSEFFDAGGTSVAALRLISQCNQEFGTALTITDFLADPSVDHLAQVLATRADIPSGGEP